MNQDQDCDLLKLLKQAYKKLKSYAYYDKGLMFLKKTILDFEKTVNYNIDDALGTFKNTIQDNLNHGKPIHEPTIDYQIFPKKLKTKIYDEKETAETIISNIPERQAVSELQYFITLDIYSYILSILWCMTVGFDLDCKFSDNSYGNRVNKHTSRSSSPFLFQYYPVQYSSWRDKSLKKVETFLNEGQTVAFITTDIKRFFYNIDFNKELKNKLIDEIKDQSKKDDTTDISVDFEIALTNHVFSVLDGYREMTHFDKTCMPLGYPPSNILSNYYMQDFDRKVLIEAHPDYYGRYVDDMVFVIRLDEEIPPKETESLQFIQKRLPGLFNISTHTDSKTKCTTDKICAHLNLFAEKYTENQVNILCDSVPSNSTLQLNLDKTRVFIFDPTYSDMTLAVLKRNIEKNSSEFRYVPDQKLFDEDLYSIFKEFSNDSHKPSELTTAVVDKYGLSKFLGKYQRIISVFKDVQIKKVFKKLLCNLNDNVLLENYTLWERLLQISIQITDLDEYENLINKLTNLIDTIDYIPDKENFQDFPKQTESDKKDRMDRMKKSLRYTLYMCIARTSVIRWCPRVESILNIFENEKLDEYRTMFCLSRMSDKHMLPIPIDYFIIQTADEMHNSKYDLCINNLDEEKDYNLTSLDILDKIKIDTGVNQLKRYTYRPYMIKMQDLCIYNLINFVSHKKQKLNLPPDDLKKLYMNINYDCEKVSNASVFESVDIKDGQCYKIGNDNRKEISIAISNTGYDDKDPLHEMLTETEETTERTLNDIKIILNESIRNHVDLAVMPECFLPLSLVPYIINFSSKNNICLISGLKHILWKDKIYNITIISLPYEDVYKQKGSAVIFHLKKYYSPNEEKHIHDAGKTARYGKDYELMCWNNVWFSLCCCYELTDIHDRSLFKSFVDFKIAVEYNRDVNYFSSIIESLSRDLHCYCIQVNSSKYGDSRITGPFKTELKDLIKVKGGRNSTILFDTINISELRNYQIDGYNNDKFKPLPPGFRRDIPMMKQKNTLFEYIKEHKNEIN